MKRRDFFNKSIRSGIALSALGLTACKDPKPDPKSPASLEDPAPEDGLFFKISLAQWSIHRLIREQGTDPYDFAKLATGWGFQGLEYVSQLYRDTLGPEGYSPAAMKNFVDTCNVRSSQYNLPNLLIMVDGEGMLASPDDLERQRAIENHSKWIDAAADMGCHSIRVNLNGSTDPDIWFLHAVDSLKALCDRSERKGINILVENHGGLSSDGVLLSRVIEEVGLDLCGTLPDFGNFCIEKDPDSGDCLREYDKYRGVRELMPYAKALSAKSKRFNREGDEIDIDFRSMLMIAKSSGYSGYISVEYEGDGLTEEAGILATKKLLETAGRNLV